MLKYQNPNTKEKEAAALSYLRSWLSSVRSLREANFLCAQKFALQLYL